MRRELLLLRVARSPDRSSFALQRRAPQCLAPPPADAPHTPARHQDAANALRGKLYAAVKNGDAAAVARLLSRADREEPLLLKAAEGWSEAGDMEGLLLEPGDDISVLDPATATAALLVACEPELEVAHSLAARRAATAEPDPNESWCNPEDGLGYLPLNAAAARGEAGIIELLLESGADINAREPASGKAALHVASEFGQAAALDALLAAGASPLRRARYGHSALHYAADSATVWRLLAARAPLEGRDAAGHTPLLAAALNARPSAVDALLVVGADIAAVDARGWSALHFCCGSTAPSRAPAAAVAVVRVLLDRGGGALLDARTNPGTTPLMFAARSGCCEAVELLIQHGADVAAADGQGAGVLHYLGAGPPAEGGKRSVVSLPAARATLAALLAAGADPAARDAAGRDALASAVKNANVAAAVAMLESSRWSADNIGAGGDGRLGIFFESVRRGIVAGYDQQVAPLQAEVAALREQMARRRDARELVLVAAADLSAAARLRAEAEAAAAAVEARTAELEARAAAIEARAAAVEARAAQVEAAAAAAGDGGGERGGEGERPQKRQCCDGCST